MNWYAVHTKARQEEVALLNLERQGYECYLPRLKSEKLIRRKLVEVEAPLFPRYLFIHLDISSSGKSWSPIRSTIGVSRLVCFGTQPAKVDPQLVQFLKTQETARAGHTETLFKPGDKLIITEGPFSGLEAVFEMSDSEQRAMVLIEFLSKQVRVATSPAALKRAS